MLCAGDKSAAVAPAVEGVTWQSLDPRTGRWIVYKSEVALSLEKQYLTGRRSGKIDVSGFEFTMDFTPGAMRQVNQQGKGRRVDRIESGHEKDGSYGAKLKTKSGSVVAADRGRMLRQKKMSRQSGDHEFVSEALSPTEQGKNKQVHADFVFSAVESAREVSSPQPHRKKTPPRGTVRRSRSVEPTGGAPGIPYVVNFTQRAGVVKTPSAGREKKSLPRAKTPPPEKGNSSQLDGGMRTPPTRPQALRNSWPARDSSPLRTFFDSDESQEHPSSMPSQIVVHGNVEATTPGTAANLMAKLKEMTLRDVKKRAREMGVRTDTLDDVEKQAVIELILAKQASTEKNCPSLQGVEWYSQDPRTGDWVAYDQGASAWLEDQYQSGVQRGTVRVAGIVFEIDFTEDAMEQINDDGYARSVQRIVSTSTSSSALPRQRGCHPHRESKVVRWRSLDPRTGCWVEYPSATSKKLENRYQKGKNRCNIEIDGVGFVVHFGLSDMWQENSEGKCREVERTFDVENCIRWRSCDPRTNQWSDYNFAAASSLEAQYQEGTENGMISIGGTTFSVQFTAGAMKQGNDTGFHRDVQRLGPPVDRSNAKVASNPSADAQEVASSQVVDPVRPALYVTGTGWTPYNPDPYCVLVIGPGAGTRKNAAVYDALSSAGYKLKIVHGGSHDQYPSGWQRGQPDVEFNDGYNLAALADEVVYTTIARLVKKGRGPSVIVSGSRGGQVTVPRLWKHGWRGPTVMINAGCVSLTRIPGAPVHLALYTCGKDFFKTRDPEYTKANLRKTDKMQPVLLYHHPLEAHMPSRLDGWVLQQLCEVAQDGFPDKRLAVGTSGQWPPEAIIEKI